MTFQILKMSIMISTDARSSGNSVARKITEWLAFTAKKTTGPGSRS